MKKLVILIFLATVVSHKGYCDAFAKPYMIFEIVHNYDFTILEVVHLESDDYSFAEFDSIIFSENTHRGFTECRGNVCVTQAYGFKKFHKLIIITENNRFETPVFIKPNWSNPTFKVIITDKSVKINENTVVYIKRAFIEILFALFITIFFELLYALIVVFRKFKYVFKYIIWVNIISVPAIWIAYFLGSISWNLLKNNTLPIMAKTQKKKRV